VEMVVFAIAAIIALASAVMVITVKSPVGSVLYLIISILAQTELCVCDLAATLGMTQSAVSHQLSLMRRMRLVKNRKVGRMVYYSLDDEHIDDLFWRGLEHVEHTG